MKKCTTEDFISKAIAKYGDLYEYHKSIYLGTDKPITITCKQHGDFVKSPHNFLKGQGCPVCNNRQRITTDIFKNRCSIIHNNRYDYSKVNYMGRDNKVCIICPIHGEFLQYPNYHLKGQGCPKCFGTPKLTNIEFIENAKKKYGDKYDYSRVNYNGNKNKIIIICKQHGPWEVTPNNFIRGSECPKCYGTPKYTTEDFIRLSREVHGNKYDYSLVNYDGLKRKVKIVCPIHGQFDQTASAHIKGCGCPTCSGFYLNGERIKFDLNKFLELSTKSHKINYNYENVAFTYRTDKVKIICPIHGEFKQGAYYHAKGGNCPKCVGGRKLDANEFIEKSREVHGNKYDYSKINYVNYSTKVCIICKHHGEFWQTPNNHLFGAGCPSCPQSNLEGEMRNFLINHNIRFEQEKTFDWLRYKKKLFLDFYLPDYNIAIECQGLQHFNSVDLFGGESFYNLTLKRDKAKFELCTEHGIKILYFSNALDDYPYQVISTFNDLLMQIEKYYICK